MFKTIVRIVSIALVFLAVCWIAGSSWYQFKHDIDLKNPLDVFHINTPSLEEPDINTPQVPEVDAKDNDKDKDKKEDINKEDKQDTKEDKKQDNKKDETTKGITKEELDELVSSIRISSNSQKDAYSRDSFEKPTHSYKFNNQKLTRNKYAWHVSKYLNSETPFSYNCPYTNLDIKDTSKLDFEHIIPLNYIHKYGDVNWTNSQKNKYAYDMLIGMDVYNSANRSHSDKGPSEWLPDKNISSYCLTWLTIAKEYDIALRKIDIDTCKLEILNDLDNAQFINQFNENTDEYKAQQEWANDICLND